MLSQFYRPASCRNFVAFGAGSLAVFWLISALPWTPVSAHAHEGHDDVIPAGNAAKGLPGLAVKSETYELVAMLDGERLTIYLDRYEDNSPVPNANISILIDAETVAAEPTSDGTYLVQSKLSSLAVVRSSWCSTSRRPKATIFLLAACCYPAHHRRKALRMRWRGTRNRGWPCVMARKTIWSF